MLLAAEIGKDVSGAGLVMENQKFSFAQVESEMPLRHPRGNVG